MFFTFLIHMSNFVSIGYIYIYIYIYFENIVIVVLLKIANELRQIGLEHSVQIPSRSSTQTSVSAVETALLAKQ